jgi:hypothetical protein
MLTVPWCLSAARPLYIAAAMLTVDDDTFWEGVEPVVFGSLPQLQVGSGSSSSSTALHCSWARGKFDAMMIVG